MSEWANYQSPITNHQSLITFPVPNSHLYVSRHIQRKAHHERYLFGRIWYDGSVDEA